MLEFRLVQGSLLKKVLESIKDLVTDANFDCSSTGFSLQAMDSSHVALVTLLLRSDGFEHYQCDRNISMGMNIGNMVKMLKCAENDDIITLKAGDGSDTVTFMFESPTQDKIADFEMKLMDINTENLGIPETEYDAIVKMPSAEFAKICRDLSSIGDTVVISVNKEGVRFSTKGDIGSAYVVYRENTSVDKPEDSTVVQIKQPVTLTFALRYMNSFAKATPLSEQVTFSLSPDMPAVVEYKIADMGYIRFYLAPKIDEEEEDGTHMENTTRPQAETKPKAERKPKAETKEKEIKPKVGAKSENKVVPVEEIDDHEDIMLVEPKAEEALVSVEEIDPGEEVKTKLEVKAEDDTMEVK